MRTAERHRDFAIGLDRPGTSTAIAVDDAGSEINDAASDDGISGLDKELDNVSSTVSIPDRLRVVEVRIMTTSGQPNRRATCALL